MDMRCFGNGLGLFLIGATIGSAASLMLAPESGRRMRKKLRRRFEREQDRAVDASSRLVRGWHALNSSGRAVGHAGSWTWKKLGRVA